LTKLLTDLETWPHRFPVDEIQYGVAGVNAGIQPNKITEILGLKALSEVLPGLRAPWRQNETTDSVWGNINISNKTASINHGDPKQRKFDLRAHKFDYFSNWVVASYADKEHMKVAVIKASVVYRNGLDSYSWNEANLSKDVKLFDLRTQAEEFRAYLLTKPAPPEMPAAAVPDESESESESESWDE